MIDEYNDGNKCSFDGHVQAIDDKGVDVLYLGGYRSRNDFVHWADIVAKVDEKMPHISLKKEVGFSGHFLKFEAIDEITA
jgi:hypothetical protein